MPPARSGLEVRTFCALLDLKARGSKTGVDEEEEKAGRSSSLIDRHHQSSKKKNSTLNTLSDVFPFSWKQSLACSHRCLSFLSISR